MCPMLTGFCRWARGDMAKATSKKRPRTAGGPRRTDGGGALADGQANRSPELRKGRDVSNAHRTLSPLVVPALLVVGVLVVYSPVLWSPFGFMDDYAVLRQRLLQPGDLFRFSVGGGRPLGGVLLHIGLGVANDIAGLRLLHLLAILGLGLLAVALYESFLSLTSLSVPGAAFLGFLIVLLPPFHVFSIWAVLFPVPFAAIAALLAGRIVVGGNQRPVTLLAAGGLLTASILVYQPAAMLFLVPVALRTLSAPHPSVAVKAALLPAAVFSSAAVLGGVAVLLGVRVAGSGGERATMMSAPTEKASWLMREVLPRSLDLLGGAQSTPRYWVAAAVAAFLVTGLYLWLEGTVGSKLYHMLLVLLLIPLAYLPNLAVAESWASYRSRMAIMTVVAVLVFFAAQGFSRRLPGASKRLVPAVGLIVLAAFAATTLREVTLNFVVPQTRELHLARLAVERLPAETVQRGVVVAPATWQDSLGESVAFDEYGIPSSAASWVPAPMVELILREQGLPWSGRARLAQPGDSADIDFHELLTGVDPWGPR